MDSKSKSEPIVYTCAACRTRVAVVDGHIIRVCPHSDAAVLADLKAVATGVSQLAGR